MDNVITVNHRTGGTYDFHIEMVGVDVKKTIVKMVIKLNDYEVLLDCKPSEDGKTFTVEIPNLPIFEKTAYDFKICIVTDDHYFEPYKGIVNFVPDAEIYVSPANTEKKESKKDSKKELKKEEKEEKKESKEDKKDVEKKSEVKKESFFKKSILQTIVTETSEPVIEKTPDEIEREKFNKQLQEMLRHIK